MHVMYGVRYLRSMQAYYFLLTYLLNLLTLTHDDDDRRRLAVSGRHPGMHASCLMDHGISISKKQKVIGNRSVIVDLYIDHIQISLIN